MENILDTPAALNGNSSVQVIERSLEVFKDAGKILIANEERTEKALAVGRRILSDIQANEGRMTAELDERCNKYLANINQAVSQMNDQRKPVTQIMDAIKKMYTEIENKLDLKKPETIPAIIHKKRNEYAKQVFEEQERIRVEAEQKARKEKQRVELAAWIQNTISDKLISFLETKRLNITNAFNAITLENFDEKAAKLQEMNIAFPVAKLAEIIKYEMPAGYSLLDFTAKNTVQTEAHTAFDFKTFYAEYEQAISELKQQLHDRLPSKKLELEEIAEQKRLQEENEKKMREAKSKKEKEAAEQRRLEIEAEQKRLADEKELREKQEQDRIQKEAEDQKLKAEQKAESDRMAGTTMAMFDQAAAIGNTAAPEARQGFDIIVTHQAGYVEIFKFWFTNEGVNCSIDEIDKMTMKQMKKYCETMAHKNDHKIVSKYLKYEPSFTAVNRKAK